MRIAIFPDPHWCQNSSIVRSRGSKYSVRLENLIKSINWVEECAWNHHCDTIVCAGDFFDSSQLNAEEVSALRDISWAPLSHVFITGNHETNVSSLEYATSDLFSLCPNITVINKPQQYMIDEKTELCFLPYVLERDRKTIQEYFGPKHSNRIIFSHNDLKDVQYGPFKSTEGFEVKDIEDNCDFMFNGHIHHCGYVTPKIFHCGNLTGQNFTEDAFKFEHTMQIIDTDSMSIDFFENPFAFNFYKIDGSEFTAERLAYVINTLKYNAVITLKIKKELKDIAETLLKTNEVKIIASRIVIEQDLSKISNDESTSIIEGIDHLKQFENYVLHNIGESNVVKEELMYIMR